MQISLPLQHILSTNSKSFAAFEILINLRIHQFLHVTAVSSRSTARGQHCTGHGGDSPCPFEAQFGIAGCPDPCGPWPCSFSGARCPSATQDSALRPLPLPVLHLHDLALHCITSQRQRVIRPPPYPHPGLAGRCGQNHGPVWMVRNLSRKS